MTDEGRTTQKSQDWRQLYEAAILELDPKLLPGKIFEAQKAIAEHACATTSKQDDVEQQALRNAEVALDDLKKIYRSDGRAA
jgi:hypothetical protein